MNMTLLPAFPRLVTISHNFSRIHHIRERSAELNSNGTVAKLIHSLLKYTSGVLGNTLSK